MLAGPVAAIRSSETDGLARDPSTSECPLNGNPPSSGAHTGNRLDVSAYRCVDVAGRNRQNSTASIFPVVTGCHPACAINNATNSIWFSLSL
jgi:hypothetical protein